MYSLHWMTPIHTLVKFFFLLLFWFFFFFFFQFSDELLSFMKFFVWRKISKKKMEKENTNIWLRWGTIFEKKEREIRNQNNQMMMGFFFLNFWMRFCLLTEILWFMTWRILGGMKIHLKKFRTKNIVSYIQSGDNFFYQKLINYLIVMTFLIINLLMILDHQWLMR